MSRVIARAGYLTAALVGYPFLVALAALQYVITPHDPVVRVLTRGGIAHRRGPDRQPCCGARSTCRWAAHSGRWLWHHNVMRCPLPGCAPWGTGGLS